MAILTAIVVPVASRVKDSARRQTSLSNLGQQGAAMIMYGQDNDDRYPLLIRSDAAGNNGWLTWIEVLGVYLPSKQVFRSPNSVITYRPWEQIKHYGGFPLAAVQDAEYFASSNVRRGHWLGTPDVLHDGLFGYASDSRRRWYEARSNVPSLRQSTVPQPSTTALVFEANMFDANYLSFDWKTKVGWCAIWSGGGQQWFDLVGAAAKYTGGERDCSSMVMTSESPLDPRFRIIANGTIPTVFADGSAKALPPLKFYSSRESDLYSGRRAMVYHWTRE